MELLAALKAIFHENRLRSVVICLFFAGVAMAATQPFQSIVALEVLKIDGRVYALVFFLGSVFHVACSLTIGALSDRLKSRTVILLLAALFGVVGYGIVFLGATPEVFLLSVLFLVPVASVSYSQYFAVLRVSAAGLPGSDSVISIARAFFSLSWILSSFGVALYLAMDKAETIDVYAIAAGASLVCLLTVLLFMRDIAFIKPSGRKATVGTDSVRLPLAGILLRVACVGLIEGALKLHGMVYGLVVTQNTGGTTADVGVISGVTAALEIPFMLLIAALLRWMTKSTAMSLGALVYCIYLLLLSRATSMPQIYIYLLLNAAGTAVILSVSIGYLQDLLENSPGLGSSLLSVTSFLATGLSSMAFAIVPELVGFQATAAVAAGFAGAGALGILILDHATEADGIRPR